MQPRYRLGFMAFSVVLLLTSSLSLADEKGTPSPAGPTVINREFRADGKTPKLEVIQQPDGSTVTKNFEKDGKTVYSEEIKNKDGSGSLTVFRGDGKTLWEKYTWGAAGSNRETLYYSKTGKHMFTRSKLPGSSNIEMIKCFRDDGSLSHSQMWYTVPLFLYDEILGEQKLGVVIEFDLKGRMKRKITMHQREDADAVPKAVYDHSQDGVLVIRKFRADGTLESEERLEKQVSQGVKKFTVKDNVRETLDEKLVKQPMPE